MWKKARQALLRSLLPILNAGKRMVCQQALSEQAVKLHIPGASPFQELQRDPSPIVETEDEIHVVEHSPPLHLLDALQRNNTAIPPSQSPALDGDPILEQKGTPKPE